MGPLPPGLGTGSGWPRTPSHLERTARVVADLENGGRDCPTAGENPPPSPGRWSVVPGGSSGDPDPVPAVPRPRPGARRTMSNHRLYAMVDARQHELTVQPRLASWDATTSPSHQALQEYLDRLEGGGARRDAGPRARGARAPRGDHRGRRDGRPWTRPGQLSLPGDHATRIAESPSRAGLQAAWGCLDPPLGRRLDVRHGGGRLLGIRGGRQRQVRGEAGVEGGDPGSGR